MNERFYKISKNIIFISWGIFFAILVIMDSLQILHTSIIKRQLTLIIAGLLFLLLGTHFLYYKKFWIEDSIKIITKHLENKSQWYQSWLSVRKEPAYNKFFILFGGILLVSMGLLILVPIFLARIIAILY